jgi:hypothetical protein
MKHYSYLNEQWLQQVPLKSCVFLSYVSLFLCFELFYNKLLFRKIRIEMSSLDNFVMFAKDQDDADALIHLKG